MNFSLFYIDHQRDVACQKSNYQFLPENVHIVLVYLKESNGVNAGDR